MVSVFQSISDMNQSCQFIYPKLMIFYMHKYCVCSLSALRANFLASSTNMLDMFIVVGLILTESLSSYLKWVPTMLVRSQWFLNLLPNQAWAASFAKSVLGGEVI